jgi:AcrR family transcriptional regulator
MRDRILETADRLFYGQGIRAIGVDTIAAEIGISKRTLYNHFPSKDALIAAYLSRRFTPLELSDAPPASQILDRFERLQRLISGQGFRGCPFVNAVAELGESSPPVNEIAIAFKEQQREWFRDLLTRAGATDPDGLATQLAILVDGAIATALVRGEPALARAAKAAAVALLGVAGVSVSDPTNP